MRYLAPEEILVIHAYIIDQTGGSHGLRELGLLISACERPKSTFGGKLMYKGVFPQAAALFESLARNHPFVDGNKRTAITSAVRFLELNGYRFVATNKEVETFVVSAVKKKLALADIVAWLRENSGR